MYQNLLVGFTLFFVVMLLVPQNLSIITQLNTPPSEKNKRHRLYLTNQNLCRDQYDSAGCLTVTEAVRSLSLRTVQVLTVLLKPVLLKPGRLLMNRHL